MFVFFLSNIGTSTSPRLLPFHCIWLEHAINWYSLAFSLGSHSREPSSCKDYSKKDSVYASAEQRYCFRPTSSWNRNPRYNSRQRESDVCTWEATRQLLNSDRRLPSGERALLTCVASENAVTFLTVNGSLAKPETAAFAALSVLDSTSVDSRHWPGLIRFYSTRSLLGRKSGGKRVLLGSETTEGCAVIELCLIITRSVSLPANKFYMNHRRTLSPLCFSDLSE